MSDKPRPQSPRPKRSVPTRRPVRIAGLDRTANAARAERADPDAVTVGAVTPARPEGPAAPVSVPVPVAEPNAAAGSEPAGSAPAAAIARGGAEAPRRGRWRLPLALTAIAVGLGIGAGALWFTRTPMHLERDNLAFVDTAETDAVRIAASEALKTLLTQDYEALDQNRKAIEQVLSAEMRAQLFDVPEGAEVSSWEQIAEQAKQAKSVYEASTDKVGVSDLRGDSASVVAAVQIDVMFDGVPAKPLGEIIEVDLIRVDGNWVLNEIPQEGLPG